jgi:signal transduction histidine kinase
MTLQRQPTPSPALDIVGQLPVGVMLMDADGDVVHENDALRELWGDLLRAPADAPFPADAYGPDGSVLRTEDWPIRRSLATGEEVHDVAIELERPDDDPVSIVTESRPLVDERGGRIGAVMVVRDVTAAHDQAMLREAFVGILSHELRTPVTSIYSGVELLRTHHLSESVSRDVLNDVAVEAETLQRLIDDLLVMVRVERGVQLALAEPVLVHRIVSLALADERRRWTDRHFVATIPTDLPTAMADDGLLRQVLRNLLSNAAKYGPPDSTIFVTAREADGWIELRVTDEGPGIAVDQRERVFDLFYRGTMAARIQGSGVGLYVARALMEAMGGTIVIGDQAQGAEFILRLPIYRDQALEDGATSDEGPARSVVRSARGSGARVARPVPSGSDAPPAYV